jgi:O-antigen/teichoic acid export membrane protein
MTAVLLNKNRLSEWTGFGELNWLNVIAILALTQSITAILLTIWQAEQNPIFFGVFQICKTSCNVLITLFLVIFVNLHWEGRLLGISIPTVLFGCVAFMVIWRKGYISFQTIKLFHLKDALFFGIPLIPAAIGWRVITGIDRFFINSMVDIKETGIYSVGYQFGMIIGIIANSFNAAWWPHLFKRLNEGKESAKLKIVRYTYIYFISIFALSIFVSYASGFIIPIFIGHEFAQAHIYVFWIALGFAFNGMRFMILNYIYFVKKTYISSWIPFFTAALHIGFNFYLIKRNGSIGAAQATSITFFLSFILTWILSAQVYKMPWVRFFVNRRI